MKTFPFPVFHDRAVVADDPLAYLAERRLPLTKLHGDQAPGRYPLDELAALPGVQLTAANAHDFELVAAGVDKGPGPGHDRPALRRPPGPVRRRGGQRQRPGRSPGGGDPPSPWATRRPPR